ncbi:histidine kinase [Agromyces sp. SYSU K20354]|uniref:sensor histidine kinase n=1 Tax=Agromyces cavernae TaxID=2898659 RepID=UPI001E4EBA60|nr:histidine kinase [Agromyces cavernae]MCD2441797.1 histidine kinase [Agromyces cavernae]
MTTPAQNIPSPVNARAGSSRPPSTADWVWAGAAAAALLPLTLVEIFAAARLPQDGWWLAATLTLYAVLHTTVALRRRWLRTTLAAASACMFGLVLASLPGMPFDAVLLPSSLCFLVIVFTAAASDDRLADVASIVVGLVGAAMMTAVSVPWAPTAGPGELIALAGFLIASIGAAWALGRYRRESRRKLAAQQVGRAQAAELRLQADRAAEASERRRIGRELHDVVSHSLAVMVAQAEASRLLLGRDDDRARVAVGHVVSTGRAAMSDMRGLLGALVEPDGERGHESALREPSPGLEGIDELVERAQSPGRVVELVVAGTPVAVPPGLSLTVYRVVQESLTNVMRHAAPPTCTLVGLDWGDALVVTVEDDGSHGAEPVAWVAGGRGIAGMRERVAQLGGAVEAGPRTDAPGWKVTARLPLTGASDQPQERRR